MRYAILSLLATVFLLFGCSSEEKRQHRQKPSVVVTTFAIFDAAQAIGGEDVDVFLLLPPGQEVHTFEPTPRDIVRLEQASLFFYSGAGLEPWAKRFDDGKKGVDLSRYVTLTSPLDHHEHTGLGHHKGVDPHYWLDFTNMKKIASVIAQKYSMLLPQKKELFTERLKAYKRMLRSLDERYKAILQGCKKKEIFVNHNAYSYLAKRYGFSVDSLTGLSPDAGIAPKAVERLHKRIKDEGVKVVFFEPFENVAVLRSVADDLNLRVDTLQPLGNITAEEAKQRKSYRAIMLENLEKLRQALECDGV